LAVFCLIPITAVIMYAMLKQVQKLTGLILLWVSLPAFLLVTNPETSPLPLLIVPFILLAAALYNSAEIILRLSFNRASDQRTKITAAVVALLPTLLLILASIRQLTIRDTAIVGGLLLLLVFYMRRLDFLGR
jgi:heme/copper-type cytochrome/quinol oxidase subunit 4